MLMKLAQRLDKISFDAIPEATVHKAKMAILNYIGGSLPGAKAKAVEAEKALWKGWGAAGDCPVLGSREKLSPIAAAAVNAMMGQVFLQEDCHESSISHPGVIVIPTALALAHSMHLDGRALIEGVVCGYEGQGRIGRCLIRPGFPRNGLRPAACVGPFGSVSAAAKLLGLDAGGIRDAISIAGNSCSGVMECTVFGSDDMCIQNCYSAKNGIQAAFEAKYGLHGAYTILEGRFGLGMALNNCRCDWSILGGDDYFEIDDTFIKIYPGCGHVLPTAQAAVELVKKHGLRAEDVERVEVGTRAVGKSFPGCDNPGPFEGHISAMMSHQFMVGAALCRGNVDVAAVKNYADPAIYEMAQRVSVSVDSEVDALPESGGRVTMYLRDGRVFESFQHETLPQSDKGVIERMRANGAEFYSPGRLEKIISTVMELEKLRDVSELSALLEPDIPR